MAYDYISIKFKTNISYVYFDEEEDSDRFDEWLNQLLKQLGLFDYSLVLDSANIEGASKLSIFVDDFDYQHYLHIRVHVDDNIYTYDELADNEPLLNYIDREVAPMLVSEFNHMISNISFPMSRGGTEFRYMKFDNEEFYCVLGYSEKFGFFPASDIRKVPFVIEDTYEVYV